MKKRVPRLRTVLLLVNLVILTLPLGGILLLRFYESELVLQTETELIAQGALIGVAYHQHLLEILESSHNVGSPMDVSTYGIPVQSISDQAGVSPFTPILPQLDLFEDEILTEAPEATNPPAPPDPPALIAGKNSLAMVMAAKKYNLAGVRIVDYNGTVVASSGSELGKSLLDRNEVRAALTGKYSSVLRRRVSDQKPPPMHSISRRAWVRVFVAIPIKNGDRVLGAVVLSRTPLDITKSLYGKRIPILKLMAALLCIVLLVSIFTAMTISRPVQRLIQQADRITQTDRASVEPLKNPGTQEVARLSESITRMAKTLNERADYIRTFASHVSHEFKSPLASIRATVELLEDHIKEMDLTERDRFLRMIDSDAQRLERLVGRLLEMAKADVLRPGEKSTKVGELLEALGSRFNQEGLSVIVENDSAVATVKMASEILESVISTLVNNARQHGGQEVGLTLSCTLAEKSMVEIFIIDDGVGVSEANASRIFQPFFTTAKDTGGSGLGLPIAQKLVEVHGGRITLEKTGPGAVFKVRLPV